MDPTLQELQAALTALRTEIDAVKAELKELRTVVQIYEEEGQRHALIECTDFVLRAHGDTRLIAVQMGTLDTRGYINIHDWTGDPAQPQTYTAVEIGIEAENHPVIRLRGTDYKSRAEFSLDKNDCGIAAVFSPGHRPGACMKASQYGGSVAVLQADGQPRGALLHESGAPDNQEGKTQFWLLDHHCEGMFKATTDADGTALALGGRAESSAISLAVRADSCGIMVNGPGRSTGGSILAGQDFARITAFSGEQPGSAADATLSVSPQRASLQLNRPDSTPGCELHATSNFTCLMLKDPDSHPAAALTHYDGSHAALTLRGMAAHDCIEAAAMKDVASIKLTSPHDQSCHSLILAQQHTCSLSLLQRSRVTVQLSQDESGGFVTATGLTETPGNAAMRGGAYAGSFVVGTGDGTALLGIGATDHGGQLVMNNDLGFQRIFMGVHAESSTLHFNHTGSPGIQVTAGPNGGVISVHDSEGRMRQVIDAENDDD
jgi:hypothetical protein